MSANASGPTAHDDEFELAQLVQTDPLAVMRACHDRRLEREGIPMFIGLQDERGTVPQGSPAQVAEGAALADTYAEYAAALIPWARDDDEGAVITAMQVVSVTHFTPRTNGAA